MKIKASTSANTHRNAAPTEENFVLRLDAALSALVKQQIKELGFARDLQIVFTSKRLATIRFPETGDRLAVLVDLPTLSESHKSLDHKQWYKVADICQMLVVVPDEAEAQRLQSTDFKWPHGLSTPMENARRQRFRAKGSTLSGEEIEDAIQSLLDADAAAIKTEYSVTDAVAGADDDISDLVADIEGNLLGTAITDGEQSESESIASDQREAVMESQNATQPEAGCTFYDATQEDADLTALENAFQLEAGFISKDQLELESELEELRIRLDERIQQLQQAPPNPLLRQRLERGIHQLRDEIVEKENLLARL